MARYNERPTFLGKNFDRKSEEEGYDLAVERQAESQEAAVKEMQKKEAEANQSKQEIEKGKLAADNYEQMLKDKEDAIKKMEEEKETRTMAVAGGVPGDPGYDASQIPGTEEFIRRVTKEDSDKKEATRLESEHKTQVDEDISALKKEWGLDKFREREQELYKISNEIDAVSSKFVVRLSRQEFDKREEKKVKDLETEDKKLKENKLHGVGEEGGGEGSKAPDDEKKYGDGTQSAKEVVDDLLRQNEQ